MGSTSLAVFLVVVVVVLNLITTGRCIGGPIPLRRSLEAQLHAVVSSSHVQSVAESLVPAAAEDHEATSRSKQEEVSEKVLRAQLIHRDHPKSPLSTATISTHSFVRVAAAVRRSLARHEYLSDADDAAARPRRGLISTTVDFQSPVTKDLGEYTMTLSVGTPPQQYSFIVDTGSDLVWLNCAPCAPCINQSNSYPFDPSSSSSFSDALCTDAACLALPNNWGSCAGTSCGYQYAYGDGSGTEGELAYETFTVTNVDGSTTAIPNVTFGCGHNQTGNSFNGADGVAGMGQGQISLPSQFQNLFPDIFTYCLVSASSSSSTATVSSSTLLFGSPENTGAGISSLVYTPLLENLIFPTFYYVGMTGISVGGTLLTIPTTNFDIAVDGTGGVIFDSGTTYTLLTLDAYNAASQAVQSLMTYPIISSPLEGLDLMCFDVTGVDPASNISVPTMVFHFQSSDASSTGGPATVDYVLDLENVYVYLEHAALCLTILPTINGLSVIGNSAQVDHQIVFDRVNNQIGWASTTC